MTAPSSARGTEEEFAWTVALLDSTVLGPALYGFGVVKIDGARDNTSPVAARLDGRERGVAPGGGCGSRSRCRFRVRGRKGGPMISMPTSRPRRANVSRSTSSSSEKGSKKPSIPLGLKMTSTLAGSDPMFWKQCGVRGG